VFRRASERALTLENDIIDGFMEESSPLTTIKQKRKSRVVASGLDGVAMLNVELKLKLFRWELPMRIDEDGEVFSSISTCLWLRPDSNVSYFQDFENRRFGSSNVPARRHHTITPDDHSRTSAN